MCGYTVHVSLGFEYKLSSNFTLAHIYLPIYHLSICPSVCLSTDRSLYLNLLTHLVIYAPIYLPLHPSIHLFVRALLILPIWL